MFATARNRRSRAVRGRPVRRPGEEGGGSIASRHRACPDLARNTRCRGGDRVHRKARCGDLILDRFSGSLRSHWLIFSAWTTWQSLQVLSVEGGRQRHAQRGGQERSITMVVHATDCRATQCSPRVGYSSAAVRWTQRFTSGGSYWRSARSVNGTVASTRRLPR